MVTNNITWLKESDLMRGNTTCTECSEPAIVLTLGRLSFVYYVCHKCRAPNYLPTGRSQYITKQDAEKLLNDPTIENLHTHPLPEGHTDQTIINDRFAWKIDPKYIFPIDTEF